MIDICIGIAGPLVVFAFILSSLGNATRSGVLVGRGTRTLAKRIVISSRPAADDDDADDGNDDQLSFHLGKIDHPYQPPAFTNLTKSKRRQQRTKVVVSKRRPHDHGRRGSSGRRGRGRNRGTQRREKDRQRTKQLLAERLRNGTWDGTRPRGGHTNAWTGRKVYRLVTSDTDLPPRRARLLRHRVQQAKERYEYRANVLADARALKESAVRCAHPELLVESDATATARCYFDRASAPEQESLEEAEYRAGVLADAKALKEQAVLHAHPELLAATASIVPTDAATATAAFTTTATAATAAPRRFVDPTGLCRKSRRRSPGPGSYCEQRPEDARRLKQGRGRWLDVR